MSYMPFEREIGRFEIGEKDTICELPWKTFPLIAKTSVVKSMNFSLIPNGNILLIIFDICIQRTLVSK